MIELWTAATGNGQKASIMLEESGLDYKVHVLDLSAGDYKKPEFLRITPIGKVPVIRDPKGLDGAPMTIAETTAIVFYLAEKSQILCPRDGLERVKILQWASIIASGFGPAFSYRVAFDLFAPEKFPFAANLFTKEAHRYYKIMEAQLSSTPYLTGEEYTLADVLAFPVAATSAAMLEGGLDPYPNIRKWRDIIAARPAVQRGMKIPASG